MKILSNQRKGLLDKQKIGQYLIYAGGEIILVIIGILLGLSLNKWNEGRMQLETLENDLKVIVDDLVRDTVEARRIITYHEKAGDKMTQIVNGEIHKDTLLNCGPCMSALISFQPFYIEQQGYQLLKKYEENSLLKEDSLVNNILQFYASKLEAYKLTKDLLTTNLEKNLTHWQDTYPWFTEVLGKQNWENEDFINYLMNDPIYKNKITYQRILNYNNYVPILKSFNLEASKLIADIRFRLNFPEE